MPGMRRIAAICLLGTLIVAGCSAQAPSGAVAEQISPISAEKADGSRLFDYVGVTRPHFVSVQEADLADDEIVIGLVTYGETRAYRVKALSDGPWNHVVHDAFGSIPVVVTHCDRTGLTRIFTDVTVDSLDIRCGGWLAEQQMAILVGQERYAHSASLPLDELPYVVSTWREWREAQPDSIVYVGGAPPTEGPSGL